MVPYIFLLSIAASYLYFVIEFGEKEIDIEPIDKNIKLHSSIINKIVYHLSIDSSFNRLVELSTVSKSWFRIIQNIISSFQYMNQKKSPFELHHLINYINNSITFKNNSYNNLKNWNTTTSSIPINTQCKNYHLKLIQYKDIEYFKFGEINREECLQCFNVSNLLYHLNLNQLIYKLLKLNCNNLKNVILLDTINCDTSIRHDYSCNGFFIINSLKLIWDKRNPPISYQEKLTSEPPQPEPGTKILENDNFRYSFNFLLNYNPIELIIDTHKDFETEERIYYNSNTLYLYPSKINLDNILKCNSVTSIKFENHTIKNRLLQLILNTTRISSLKITCTKESKNDLIFANLENNNTLKKLEIDYLAKSSYVDQHIYDEDFNYNREFRELLNVICFNKSINTLGFYHIYISRERYLKPLINCSNIKTIEIDYNSIQVVLNHCIINNNIKELNIYLNNNNVHSKFDCEKYLIYKTGYHLLMDSSKSSLHKIKNDYNNDLFIKIIQ